ncbi:MAG: quinolinate synthase NadA [Bacteroidetes bacterium]|nr:quinolinate synthase NadA [Bacteroidota bacterium]
MIFYKEQNKFTQKLIAMTGGVSMAALERKLMLVAAIQKLKKQKNVIILSHYYMPPELQITTEFGGVADYVGDSLGLSMEATKCTADAIIFCGVEFMAETAKILNPDKTVLLPDMGAGCSLASSINGEDVRNLRLQYPGIPVMGYINTTAETKAECDIICTSRNALAIAESFPNKQILFIPDKYMGKNLENSFRGNKKEFILWNGSCEVHEQFQNNLSELGHSFPEAEMLLHWEVPEETIRKSLQNNKGIVGSTNDIMEYVRKSDSRQFILGSECDLGAALKGMYPEKQFISPCLTCRFMKKINLTNTFEALESLGTENESEYRISMSEELRIAAYKPLKIMLDFIPKV